MNETVLLIPRTRLALAFIPACVVLRIIHRWSPGIRAGLVAVLRMVTQLLLVGYVMTAIFGSAGLATVGYLVLQRPADGTSLPSRGPT